MRGGSACGVSTVSGWREHWSRRGVPGRQGGHGQLRELLLANIVDLEEAKYAVGMVLQAKNRMTRTCGYAPVQVVFGKELGATGALVDQVTSARVQDAVNQTTMYNEAVQRAERIRTAAQEAFIWLDSHVSLRAALNSRIISRSCLELWL